jgi:hypothetical protein
MMHATPNEKPPAGTEGLGNTNNAASSVDVLPPDDNGPAHTVTRKRDELRALLLPLVDRMCRSHCWKKTSDGPRHIEQPFDAAKLNEHLFGGVSYGLSPISRGESVTKTACIDLDNHDGTLTQEHMLTEARFIAEALQQDGYTAHMFRSSGGAGLHLLLVWDQPQCARSVREMLHGCIEACGYTVGTAGVAALQAECFPKQDAVAADGAGSMWILPFGSGRGRPIGDFTGWTMSPDVPIIEAPAPRARVSSEATPDLWRLKSALDAIPNDAASSLSYDDFRNVVFAIHDATGGSDDGLELAIEFGARSPKHDEEFLRSRIWPYISSERGGAIVTARSIFQRASAAGWTDPAVLDEFEVLAGAGAPASTTRVKPAFVSETDFASGAPPTWIVKGVLPDADVGAIYGESTSGKSFFMLDLLTAIARQEPEWRGHKIKPGVRCGYVLAEGADDFKVRVKAQHIHRGAPPPGRTIALLDDAPNFTDRRAVDDLIARIKAWGELDLIAVDTLASVTPGADENAAGQMGQVIEHCKALRRATGAMILLLHHPGKDPGKGMRGSSTIYAGLDVVIEITRIEQDRIATVKKLKGGREGAEFGFRLQVLPVDIDDDGDAVESCIVTYTTAVAKSRRREPKGANEKAVWQAASGLQGIGAGEHPSANEVIEEALRHTVPPEEGKRDNRRANLLRALTSLAESGKVILNDGRVELPAAEE